MTPSTGLTSVSQQETDVSLNAVFPEQNDSQPELATNSQEASNGDKGHNSGRDSDKTGV